MAVRAPDIDGRSAADIAAQVKDLLAVYAPEWKEFDPHTGKPDSMSAALINIFARYCEIIIQRLNQVPEKNFLAFLDLLGASLQPPQPARVPLTFTLAAGSAEAAVVRVGTQAAAPPAEGEKEPVIFETERELTVTPARLVHLFTRDPEQDRFADHGAVIAGPVASGVPVFEGDQQNEHILYLGSDGLLGLASLASLSLTFTVEAIVANADARVVQWECWDGSAWQEMTVVNGDGTANLTKSGTVQFSGVTTVPEQAMDGLTSRWLRCRLLTPVYSGTEQKAGMVRSSHIPAIESVTLEAIQNVTGLALERAFSNQLPADLSKSFFPFGERPRFEDTLYLASSQAFARPGTAATCRITLVNPSDATTNPPLPKVSASADLKIQWESWSGTEWVVHGTAEVGTDGTAGPDDPSFQDTTQAFTKSGDVVLTMPATTAPLTVNGVESCWVRARIVSGNYGTEAYYTPVDPGDLTQGYEFHPATFAPPSIKTIVVDYSATLSGQLPEAALSFNDREYADVTEALNDPALTVPPFSTSGDTRPALYAGFELPSGRTVFPNRPVSLLASMVKEKYGEAVPGEASSGRLEVAWEYWNGSAWSRPAVRDDSENFTRPGIVELLPPADFAQRSCFGASAYWLRALWKSGAFDVAPRLKSLVPNTAMAVQAATITNETLGSSDQSELQRFRSSRSPVLAGQQLEVREPEAPSPDEQAVIEREEGPDALTVVPDGAGRPKETWVRWHEVPDFYASGPRDRHYVLDHLTGEVLFGDGSSGMIPTRGTGNVRMKSYRTGGGVRGNRQEGTIVQLKTTVPYIEKVVNTEASAGGAEAESYERLSARAPRKIRHRDRSVTVEDYADLAMLATSEVARARCVPLRNLAANPLGGSIEPGTVSVIVVPRTTDPKPLPTLELLARVESYLRERALPTASVSVVGPLYLRVNLSAEIALSSLEGASAVEQSVRDRLDEFLHPLTGGLDGKGWDFGREPYTSDFYALLEKVSGVDHIRALRLTHSEEPPGAKATGRFLVCSGIHTIDLIFESA